MTTTQEQEIEDALVRLDEAWSQLFRRIASDIKEYPFTLPPAQINLLRRLDQRGPMRMSDLAEGLDLTQSGCTAMVDRALQINLVERYRDPNDRRVVRVTLTRKGVQMLGEIRRVRAKILANYLSRLDPAEIQTLATLVGRAVEVMLAADQHPEAVETGVH